MRILLTAHRFHPFVGGTEAAVEHLAVAFARRGHDVTVATSAEPETPREEDRRGFRIRRFDLRRVGRFRVPRAEYRRFVLDMPWDVVHLHGQRVWSTDHLFPYLGRARAPLVLTPHGFAQWHRPRRRALVDRAYYHALLPRVVRHVACVTALTAAEESDLAGFGVRGTRVERVPDGHDPEDFREPRSGFRARHRLAGRALVLYSGGLYANKRVDRLVEAVAGLDATLVVTGKDADGLAGSLERRAREARVDLRLLGRIPREDLLAAYAEADVFALASDFEGFGLVLLEAMAAGLPFVSMPCGAAPELAASGAGIVVGSAGEMNGALRALLGDAAARQRMGAAGRAAAAPYTWERIAARYLSLFEEITIRGKPRNSAV